MVEKDDLPREIREKMDRSERAEFGEPADADPVDKAVDEPRKPRSQLFTFIAVLAIALLLIIIGLVALDYFRGHADESKSKPTTSASATAEAPSRAMPTAPATQAPTQVPAAPLDTRGEPKKTFTMPNVVGMTTTDAGTSILRLAPSARLRFVDSNGVTVEARPGLTIQETTPLPGAEVDATAGVLLVVTG